VHKNCCVPELRKANSHAVLSHSNQLLKKSSSVVTSITFFIDENVYSEHTEKPAA